MGRPPALHQSPKGTLGVGTASLVPAPPNSYPAQPGWQGQNHVPLPGMQILCSPQGTVTLPPDVGAQSCPMPSCEIFSNMTLIALASALPWVQSPSVLSTSHRIYSWGKYEPIPKQQNVIKLKVDTQFVSGRRKNWSNRPKLEIWKNQLGSSWISQHLLCCQALEITLLE